MTVETDVEVLKAQVKTLQDTSDAHEKQNREDFKEVHSRMTTMQRELNQEINLTFEKLYSKLEENNQEISGLEKWKWTAGGILIALTFVMTALQTFGALQ